MTDWVLLGGIVALTVVCVSLCFHLETLREENRRMRDAFNARAKQPSADE